MVKKCNEQTSQRSLKKPRQTISNPKKEEAGAGRPKAEKQINPKKIEILMEKGLFYHQHRTTLININMKQYFRDQKKMVYQYIDKKVVGKVNDDSELGRQLQSSQKNVQELKSMIETALTLKNGTPQIRNVWQRIYLKVTKKILKTNPLEVNTKSKMEKWGAELKNDLKNLKDLSGLITQAKKHFPEQCELQQMIVKEAYCMMARYCHFEVNINQEMEWKE